MPQTTALQIDDGTATYDLPEGLTLEKNDFDGKVESWKVAFADGAISDGEEIADRQLSLAGVVISDEREEHRQLLDEIRFWCTKKNLKLRIKGDWFTTLTRLKSFDHAWEQGFDKTVSRVRIGFQCDDPFWYANTEQQLLQSVTTSGNTDFVVNTLTGGLRPCVRGQSPIVTVTSSVGNPIPSFTLINQSDEDLQFRYSDPGLTGGLAVAVDCYNGTVKLNGVSSERYFEGEFMRLLTGANNLRYVGPPATVSVLWRPRWL